ncbi:MAG: hypothetical protein R3213_10750 [Flavobacteriaceae bacterium]|nr:hypothetical protein [Flavobacteriaceae bacterium]
MPTLKTMPVLLFLLFLTGCNGDDEEVSSIDIKGKYFHILENCEGLDGPEQNCEEFVEFYSDTEVRVLLGGGDIVFPTTYIRQGNMVQIQQTTDLPEEITFSIISETTLKRLQDDELWIKE